VHTDQKSRDSRLEFRDWDFKICAFCRIFFKCLHRFCKVEFIFKFLAFFDLFWLFLTCKYSKQKIVEFKLKKYFTYKDKQNHLRRSSVVYKLTCTCGSNYIGQTRRNLITRINEHQFDQRSEVCKHLLANPTHRFNFKQPEILGSIVGQKYSGFNFSHSDLLFPTRCCIPYVRSGLYQLVIRVKGFRVCTLHCDLTITSITHCIIRFCPSAWTPRFQRVELCIASARTTLAVSAVAPS